MHQGVRAKKLRSLYLFPKGNRATTSSGPTPKYVLIRPGRLKAETAQEREEHLQLSDNQQRRLAEATQEIEARQQQNR